MNGPYKPVSQMSPLEHEIFLKKKKLQVINQKLKDPEFNKRRTENERKRRAKLRATNPQWHEKQKQKQKQYYDKNPQVQIKSSTKWNKNHKDRKNANNRASYQRHRDEILARRKQKRLKAKREKCQQD